MRHLFSISMRIYFHQGREGNGITTTDTTFELHKIQILSIRIYNILIEHHRSLLWKWNYENIFLIENSKPFNSHHHHSYLKKKNKLRNFFMKPPHLFNNNWPYFFISFVIHNLCGWTGGIWNDSMKHYYRIVPPTYIIRI